MYPPNRFKIAPVPLCTSFGYTPEVWITIKSIEILSPDQFKIDTGEKGKEPLVIKAPDIAFTYKKNPVCEVCYAAPVYGEIDEDNDDNVCQECKEKEEIFQRYLTTFQDFHDGALNIGDLTIALLNLNPFNPETEPDFFTNNVKWVIDNIHGYLNGDHYLLSISSSGGMLQSLKG